MKKPRSTSIVIILIFFVSSCSLFIEKTKTVTFESTGGTPTETQILVVGSPIVVPEVPVKEHYVFDGWYSDAALTAPWDFTTFVSTDITLYANWTLKNYRITYHYDTGAISTGNPEIYTIETNLISFQEPTKIGHTFEGWFTDSGFNTEIQEIGADETGDRDIYAKWLVWTSAASFIIKETHTGTEIEIVDFIGLEIEVCIPDSIGGKPVTSIGESAFSKSTS